MSDLIDFLPITPGPPLPGRAISGTFSSGADINLPTIGDIVLDNRATYSESDVQLFDQLLYDGSTFDEELYPKLYAFLGTNVLDSMTSPGSTPYRIVADLT